MTVFHARTGNREDELSRFEELQTVCGGNLMLEIEHQRERVEITLPTDHYESDHSEKKYRMINKIRVEMFRIFGHQPYFKISEYSVGMSISGRIFPNRARVLCYSGGVFYVEFKALPCGKISHRAVRSTDTDVDTNLPQHQLQEIIDFLKANGMCGTQSSKSARQRELFEVA